MPIQLIIFLTKTKVFVYEISNNGQADDIIINDNSEISCKDKESIDELFQCIFDAFAVEAFGDDRFDIVIIDCGGDKKVVSYIFDKCLDAEKLNVINIEKILPLAVWNKTQIKAGEEIVVSFNSAYYKIVCGESNIVKCTGRARKGKESITLTAGDFGCLYYLNADKLPGNSVDTDELLEKETTIKKLEAAKAEIAALLDEREHELASLRINIQEEAKTILKLREEKLQWEQAHPKLSSRVEQMVKILEECKNSAEDLGGELYIKGSIPKRKLSVTINNFNEKLAFSGIDAEIKSDCVIALYYNHDADSHLNSLLITEDVFCYDWDNTQSASLIEWDTLKIVESHGDKIIFTLISGESRKMSMDDEDISDDFFVPMFEKIRKIDNFE